MPSDAVLKMRCSDDWLHYLDEISHQLRLPNRGVVITEAVRLLGDAVGVPSVERATLDPSHQYLGARIDREKLGFGRLTVPSVQGE